MIKNIFSICNKIKIQVLYKKTKNRNVFNCEKMIKKKMIVNVKERQIYYIKINNVICSYDIFKYNHAPKLLLSHIILQ